MPYVVGMKVSEVARLAHVSVRTLHHYDEVGLLVPSGRTEAGYRLYSRDDLERLQQILFYRELGFSLDEIGQLMAQPNLDRAEVLRRQRTMLDEQIRRLQKIRDLVDATINSIGGKEVMSEEQMFAAFEEEAKERWGDTEQYRESARRTTRYTKDDWQRFAAESREINDAVAALMNEGVAPDDPRAMDAAEQHRLLIDHWFYPCPHGMHAALGRMYVADPRFAANYEKTRSGMAQYMCDAITANSKRHAG